VAASFTCVRRVEDTDGKTFRFLILLAFPIFLSTEIYIDSVSRVSPDMLVSCLVFISLGTLLRLSRTVRTRDAVVLGLALGAGYICKGIFLPLAVLCVLIEFALLWRKSGGLRCFSVTAVVLAVLAIPYAAAMSWSFGHRTFGEVGALAYAWRVNGLQGDTFWQGGPDGFGQPEHPPTLLMKDPTVFVFYRPSDVTHAPWFDPPGYYYGYRHFFSFNNQVRATAGNIVTVFKLIRGQIVLYFLLLALFLRRRRWREGGGWFRSLCCVWPVLVVSLAGFSAYMAIIVYPRYIASFTSLFLLIPCMMLFAGDATSLDEDIKPRTRNLLFVFMLIGCVLLPIVRPREAYLDPVAHIRHHEFFWNDPEWRTAQYLLQNGAQPGEMVGVVKSDFLCGWAYLPHVRIIGQVGGEWLHPRIDETGIFWRLSPESQKKVLGMLHEAGAQVIVGFEKPADVTPVGWENVPGTDIWVYSRFN
jgi:hypothetical protein